MEVDLDEGGYELCKTVMDEVDLGERNEREKSKGDSR